MAAFGLGVEPSRAVEKVKIVKFVGGGSTAQRGSMSITVDNHLLCILRHGLIGSRNTLMGGCMLWISILEDCVSTKALLYRIAK